MKQKNKEQSWDMYISDGPDALPRPYDDLDEMYMTETQRRQLFIEATAELKAKIQVLKDQKKKKEK